MWILIVSLVISALVIRWITLPLAFLDREIITFNQADLDVIYRLISQNQYYFLLNCIDEVKSGNLSRLTTLVDVIQTFRTMYV